MCKKIWKIWPVMVFLILVGCTPLKTKMVDKFESRMEMKSGIYNDEYYKKYEELKEKNELEADGCYINSHCEDVITETEAVLETEEPRGSVHVTLAQNSHLFIEYYLDKDSTQKVVEECWINPGESLYYSYPVTENVKTVLYHFEHFNVFRYDNGRVMDTELKMNLEELIVFTLPEDYDGKELSVEPVGTYDDRTIELTDFYTDSQGIVHEVDGEWIINGKETKDNSVMLKPTVDCKVSYT